MGPVPTKSFDPNIPAPVSSGVPILMCLGGLASLYSPSDYSTSIGHAKIFEHFRTFCIRGLRPPFRRNRKQRSSIDAVLSPNEPS